MFELPVIVILSPTGIGIIRAGVANVTKYGPDPVLDINVAVLGVML